jgi:fatty-acyl-CoA synthase
LDQAALKEPLDKKNGRAPPPSARLSVIFHVGSSLTQALTTLSGGGCLVVLSPAGWRNPASIKSILSLVERFKSEALTSVPTVLAAALAIPLGNADIAMPKGPIAR